MSRWVVAGLGAVAVLTAAVVVWAGGVFDRGGGSGFPEGVYRYRLSAAEVLRIAPAIPHELLGDATGTFTWTIRDGTISLVQTNCKCTISRISGRYTTDEHDFTVTWPKKVNGVDFCSGPCTDHVRWRFDGKALRFEPVSKDLDVAVFWGAGKPWVKVS